MWIQEKARTGEIEYVKAKGTAHLAGVLTKYVGRCDLEWHVRQINQMISADGHELNPESV